MNVEYEKLLQSFEKLTALVETNIKPKEDRYNSELLTELATALAKAQGEFKPVMFNQENPYFKSRFADLDVIIKSVRPALSKYGLSFLQQQRMSEGSTILHSIILHSSGQWIESRTRITPPKNDMHSFASTLSYMKRHAAMSLLGITASDDVTDDDAEIAMVQTRDMMAKGPALNTKYHPKDESFDTITKEQMDELNYELQEYTDIAEQVLDGLKIQSLADMPKSKYSISMKRIREIKNLRNNGVK